jgi:predicted DNA-binding transcriptional regulator YafY
LLDDDEAMAIAVGLLTAAGGTVEGLEETSVRALTKLEQILPPRIRQRVTTLSATVVPLVRSWVTVDPDVLTTVAQACRDHERLRFEYTTRQGEQNERHVEPHQLVSISQRWYLLAFDRDREDWRTFRLDRMTSPWATRIRYEPREIPGGSAAEYVEQSLRSMPMRYQVVATIAAPAEAVAGRIRPQEGEVEPIDDEHCLLRARGDALEWVLFMLIWLGYDFEIREPVEMIDYLAAVTGRLSRSVPA